MKIELKPTDILFRILITSFFLWMIFKGLGIIKLTDLTPYGLLGLFLILRYEISSLEIDWERKLIPKIGS